MVRRQLSIVSYSAKLRPLPSSLPLSSAFFEISLSFLLFHDRKSDETSRLVLKGWRAGADLSDLEKGARTLEGGRLCRILARLTPGDYAI